MIHHTLKIRREPWTAVCDGRKRFEIRENDRCYQVGDTLSFVPDSIEWVMEDEFADCVYRITYVLSGFGLNQNHVGLGIERIK